jgi:predicted dehydrogenase/serine acetyltransferase
MQTLQFVIIGCGRIAHRHASLIVKLGKLVAVCDIDQQKLKAFADEYKALPFLSIDSFIAAKLLVDIVVICTPNGLHASQAITAMQAGYHVLVEKPVALLASDVDAMIAKAASTQKKLFTVMQNRFNQPVMAVKKTIDNNQFGKIYSIQLSCFWNRPSAYYKDNWHGTKNLDGGTLFTQFSHFIDILLWLFGPVINMSAILQNAAHKQSIEFEDQGVILFEFEKGIIGTMNYSVNAFEKNREGSLTILGENGIVKIGGEYLNKIDYQSFKNNEIVIASDDSTANDYGVYKGSMSNHHLVYESLINCVQNQQPYYTSVSEARSTIELINTIYAQQMLKNNHKESEIRDVELGENVTIVAPCNLYECTIGNNVFIGPFVEIQKNVVIGNDCKVQSHSFICEGVTVGNNCFIGHGVMFVNDLFKEGGPSGDSAKWGKTTIGNNVSIGSNATILPVNIGNNIVIGAGAVVTKDLIEPGNYVGNPAIKIT